MEDVNRFFVMGLFLLTLSWFSFTLYNFAVGIMMQVVYFTDVPGSIGLGFRTAASLIALAAVLAHLFKRGFSTLENLMSLRWVIFFEAVYWLTLFPSALWGFQFEAEVFGFPKLPVVISTGITCLAASTVTPAALYALFFKLSPNNSANVKAKWALIVGTIYILVFWFNYSMQWFAEIIRSGFGFVTSHPANTLGFALTFGGLLFLAAYSMNYALKYWKSGGSEHLNLRRVGFIVTFFGLYFDVIFALWLSFGSPTGWSMWHTFFIYHNMDLWLISLPLAGLPLLMSGKPKS